MGRIFNGLLLVLMIVAALITYDVKHRAEEVAEHVASLHASIARQKEATALLKAEWSLLSQPSRLQEITSRYDEHFRLAPFSAEQIATLDEIPFRPVGVDPPESVTAGTGLAPAAPLPEPMGDAE